MTKVNTLKNGDCGLSDGSSSGEWRLPNIKELVSVNHYDVYDRVLDFLPPGTPFESSWFNWDAFGFHWSNTMSSESYAMVVKDVETRQEDITVPGVGWPVRIAQ